MKIVAGDEARALIAAAGGRLYVSPRRTACCRSVPTLVARTRVARAEAFRSAARDGEVEVLVPRDLARLPGELHLEVHRFPRRIEAYWDGCAWVV
jgi:hypothetical protein